MRSKSYLTIGGGSSTGADFTNSSEAFTQVAPGGEFVASQTVGFGGEFGIVKKHSSFGFGFLDASFHLFRHAARGTMDPFITAPPFWSARRIPRHGIKFVGHAHGEFLGD